MNNLPNQNIDLEAALAVMTEAGVRIAADLAAFAVRPSHAAARTIAANMTGGARTILRIGAAIDPEGRS